MKIVPYEELSEDRRKESERWARIFSKAVEKAKAENERLGIVEDYSKYDDWDKEQKPLLVAEGED